MENQGTAPTAVLSGDSISGEARTLVAVEAARVRPAQAAAATQDDIKGIYADFKPVAVVLIAVQGLALGLIFYLFVGFRTWRSELRDLVAQLL